LDGTIHAVVMPGVAFLPKNVPQKNPIVLVVSVMSQNQLLFFWCMLFWMTFGAMAALNETFPMAVPFFPPVIDGLPAPPETNACLRYTVPVRIVHYPLTITGFGCYTLIHEDLLPF